MKTTLWVTTAAAALIAGATFAGAQTGGTGGASPGSSQMSQGQGATQKGAASEQKGAKPGMAQGKEERTEKKGLEGKEQRSKASDKAQGPKTEQQGKQPGMAQGKEQKKGAETKQGKQPGMAQEKGGAPTGQSTTGQQKPSTQTQTQGTSKGTTSQGTTSQSTTSQSTTSSSGSVQLSQEQRTKVHSIVVKESSARVENVSFSVSVGTVIPQDIHVKVRPLPVEVVEIVPQYRGFRFIIVRDEIIIIDPNTFKIVAIIVA